MSMVQPQNTAMTAETVPKYPGAVSVPNNVKISSSSVSTAPAASTATHAGTQTVRLNMEKMVESFSEVLGKENWNKYAHIISLFILGKLSRKELVNELDLLFNFPQDLSGLSHMQRSALSHGNLIRMHNQLLLAILANSLRGSPLGESTEGSWGFNNGTTSANKKRSNKHNSQIDTYKKIVMSLPAEDRGRLKTITKEAGKRGFVLCSVLQARLHTIPKIPIVTNPETLKRVKASNLKTPLEWSQEIVNGFSAPLATESYALPDNDSLYLRMISIAREHGLVGAVDGRCVEIMTLALENYLKNLVESAIDTVRYRKKYHSDYYDLNDDGFYQGVTGDDESQMGEDGEPSHDIRSISNEEMSETLSIYPNLVAPTGAYLNLNMCGLMNDDELVNTKSSIDDLPDFLDEKPNFTPVDDKNVGSRDELKWLIKQILTKD
ncbi:LANO_0A02674g1_1 [Lachancea nothofagi CBS 11611]|uniref:LANO_0A02674g1_1 n=1 Tax=Lachancea nothofagi CBS 11611 TaxID=1266666 RepID=A0A1G4IP64_9SACH|nr:LANO_0A02674g1_1 [Lachancea nothofagi CBS 11611]